MDILDRFDEADYILLNNQLITPEYRADAMEYPEEDDVALACQVDGHELTLTIADFEDATPMPDGAYWIDGVGSIRFLQRQHLH